MWMNAKYEPGTIKVVAYDDKGKAVAEKSVSTAGKPYALKLEADRSLIKADGEDLSYVTVSVVDKKGNLCPTATNQLKFSTKGAGKFRAVCNGDATSLEQFHLPTMKTFSGKLVVTLQSSNNAGNIELSVSGKGLKSGKIVIESTR
jgi:beta-galactosidase